MRRFTGSLAALCLAALICAAPADAKPKKAPKKNFGVFVGLAIQNSTTPPNRALINVGVGFWKRKPDQTIKPLSGFGLTLGITEIDSGTVLIGVVAGQAKSISVSDGNTVILSIPKARYLVTRGTASTNSNEIFFEDLLDVDANGELGFFVGDVAPGFIGVIGSEFRNTATSESLFAYQVPVPATGPSGDANALVLTENLGPSHPAVKKLTGKSGKAELRKFNAQVRKLYKNLTKGTPVSLKPPVKPPSSRPPVKADSPGS